MKKLFYPEHIFVLAILIGYLVGVILIATDASPYWGIRIGIGAFFVAWLPALLVFILVTIPEWWQKKRMK